MAEKFLPQQSNRRGGRRIRVAGFALFWTAVALAVLSAAPRGAVAHPGTLDEFGGHFSEKTNQYHYHRPKAEIATRKREFLTWTERRHTGEVRGKVVEIDRPDAFWIRIPYRPAYEELARLISGGNRNNRDQLVRIWFLHVSPEASARRGKTYNTWFRKKVIYELEQKMKGKDVRVQFRLVQQGKRVYGMVLLGEENVNLWLVLSGWSFYLLGQGENPNEKKFLQAETLARKHKTGLWKKGR